MASIHGHRAVVDRDRPLPMRAAGFCQARKLTERVNPRRAPYVKDCPNRATRRVQVGLAAPHDLCLWHSLTACEQLGGHLLRSP